jgi:hypothetical protein
VFIYQPATSWIDLTFCEHKLISFHVFSETAKMMVFATFDLMDFGKPLLVTTPCV